MNTPSPDAALIAACANHPRVTEAYNADAADEGPLWDAYVASRDAISDARPATLAGLLAKARAAKFEARMLDGHESPDGSMAAIWSWDIVNDLLRLCGEQGDTPVPPPIPPKPPEDQADEAALIAEMKRITAVLHKRNLENAVRLAQQALAGKGPLIDHFQELGRRFWNLSDTPQKPSLKMLDGGKQ